MIKFQSLRQNRQLQTDIDRAYVRVMTSGQYIGGREVEAFEREWADYNGADYCVGCASGLDALRLVLLALELKDIYIQVPEWTAPATWAAVEASGNIPITDMTQTEIVVHLYGIMKSYNQHDIQDCAQAHGLKLRQGICCWSFYPTKNLGCYGDGGAVTTNNEELAHKVRELGHKFSSRLDPLQAAFLRAKLPYLDGWNRQRQEFAQYYLENLQGVILPEAKWDEAVWHQFVIRTDRRDELHLYLRMNNIDTVCHYPVPPHRALGYDYDLPEADLMAATVLSLPIAPHLRLADIKIVTKEINGFFNH